MHGAKLPRILGLLIILVGLLLTVLLAKGVNPFQSRANPSQDPSDVRITNISDSSFTVSYTTDESVIGTINYGENTSDLNTIALDDRDQVGQVINKYNAHSITAKDLKPNSTYYFEINSGEKKYLNNGATYTAKTGSVIRSSPSDQLPMSGRIIDSSGNPVKEGILYVEINGAQSISSLIKTDGSYLLSLNNLRNARLNSYFSIPASSIIAIEAKTNSSSAKATVGLGDINPVAPIAISNNYDFSTQVAAVVSNPKDQVQNSFPAVGQKAIENQNIPTAEPAFEPTNIPTIIPTQAATPDASALTDQVSPSPIINPQPTLMTTGESSVIMMPVSIGILIFGILLFLSTGKKFHL